MTKRRRADGDDFERLKRIGLELDPPVDEFSEQPGSGSAIGGRRGEQEYGISGGIAQEDAHDRNYSANVDANPADLEREGEEFPRDLIDRDSPGVSQYTTLHTEGPEESKPGSHHLSEDQGEDVDDGTQDMSLSELEGLLRERLARHPELQKFEIEATVVDFDAVTLEGRVATDAERLLAEEIAEAVIGSAEVENKIVVIQPAHSLRQH